MNYFRRVQNAIDHIENNLSEDIILIAIADVANCSLYHFHRLFHALVGNTLKAYIRKRRLTLAAKELVETKRTIIDIAFEYQYGAPESFTRAFKKLYGITPIQFRKRGVFLPLNEKADLLKINSVERERGIKMQPVIKEKDAFFIVGIESKTRLGNCQQDVPKLWRTPAVRETLKKLGSSKADAEIFGICYGTCNGECHEAPLLLDTSSSEECFSYLIGSAVGSLDHVPHGFVSKTIARSRYAVFSIKGGVTDIQKGVASIYKDWVSSTSYELADGPSFEKYDEIWEGKAESEMEFWLPIK